MRPLLFALLLFAAAASAQTIGVYRDPNATGCPVIPALGPTTVYVVATLSPAACGGIAGAGFRLVGWPQDWFYMVDTGPGIPPIGDLFNSGYNLAWQCRTSESGAVLILSFLVFATSMVSDIPVTVTHPTTNAVPPFLCPTLVLCDAPVYTKLCAAGVETRLNPLPTGGFCPCQTPCFANCPSISVDAASWSGIKHLYN